MKQKRLREIGYLVEPVRVLTEEERLQKKLLEKTSGDPELKKYETEVIAHGAKLAWSVIALKEKLLKEHPEDKAIIENAYVKTIYSMNKNFVSDKDVYVFLKREIKECFFKSYELEEPFSVYYPLKTLMKAYPGMEKQVYDWAEYLSKLFSLMEIGGYGSVYDNERDNFWDKYAQYFPTREYVTGKVLHIGSVRGEKNEFIKSRSGTKNAIHETLEKYLEPVTPLIFERLQFMQENNISNDLQLLDEIYRNDVEDRLLQLSPLWEKAGVLHPLEGKQEPIAVAGERAEETESVRPVETKQESLVEAGRKAEGEVDYVLSWLHDSHPAYQVMEKKSTNHHTGRCCIRLCNEKFRNEPQEIDHIVVGPQGVFLIETKNVGGRIFIDEHGNWSRMKDGEEKGIKNPVQQVMRHEALVRSVVGAEVNVYSIICIANEKTLIQGQDHCNVPVVKSELLAEYILNVESENLLDHDGVTAYVQRINEYVV